MLDMLPFPRIMGDTPDKQIVELVTYLVQFKETLEFALRNISTENLSPELVNKLNELGAGIEKSNENREDEIAQVSSKTLTVSDVCNSEVFKLAVEEKFKGYTTFNVNFETGHLEYNTSNEGVNNG
jgi:hypothetical protein